MLTCKKHCVLDLMTVMQCARVKKNIRYASMTSNKCYVPHSAIQRDWISSFFRAIRKINVEGTSILKKALCKFLLPCTYQKTKQKCEVIDDTYLPSLLKNNPVFTLSAPYETSASFDSDSTLKLKIKNSPVSRGSY